MSIVDIATLIGVVVTVVASVAGGVFATASMIRGMFGQVHSRINDVSKENCANHLEVTNQITSLTERINAQVGVGEAIRRS